jgi:tetratricopeptide (TPR) repeat protein
MKSPEIPNEAVRHLERAYSYKETCDYERVLREADAAIAIDPSLAEAHNLRGIALEELGRKDEALKAYGQAISIDPGFREAKNNLSDLERALAEKYQIVTVATFIHPVEANIAKTILDTEGIWSLIADENINRLYPLFQGGLRLQVRETDAERALELLNEKRDGAKALEEELGKDEKSQEPPSRQSPVPRHEKSNTLLSFFKKRK